jgi:hypothetical protein
MSYFNTPTLDNGAGGGRVIFTADFLNELPALVNGATYDATSIADAMLANKYFTPSNYTPQDGPLGEWKADSVVGNLKGIDEALSGGGVGIPTAYAETYFQDNVTPTPFGAPNTPTKVIATYNSGDLQQFTQVGGTFTYTGLPNRELNLTAMITATYEGTAQNTSFYITKNGTPIAKSKQTAFIGPITPGNQPLPVQVKTPAVTGNTFELWVENNDNTNSIVVRDVNFGIESLDLSVANIGLLPSYAGMDFQDNVTPTPISAPNTPVKIVATYNAGELKDFTHLNGTLTYQSPVSKVFDLRAVMSATYNGTAQNTSFYIAVSGSVVARSKQKEYIGPTTPADKPAICQALIPLNLGNTVEVWVENNDNSNDPIVSDFNFIAEAMDAIGTSPNISNLTQLIWVNNLDGSDLNQGTIDSPLKTYEAARLLAVSRNPSVNLPFSIILIGKFNITGNMTISPFVNVVGDTSYSTIVIVSGNVVLDAAWGTTTTPFTVFTDIDLVAAGISLVYPAFQAGSFLRFQNSSLQLPNVNIAGAGTNASAERVIFDNCTTDIFGNGPNFTTDNVNFSLLNSATSGVIDVAVTSAVTNANCIIQNLQGPTGNMTINATSTGTLATYISGCDTGGRTLTIDGTSNTVTIDADSYKFKTFAFGSGASFANIKGSISFLIYIDQLNGDDNNSGTINYPMQNYDAARLEALARGANSSQPWDIIVVGAHNIAGDMTLSPNVCIEGQNPYTSGFIVNGNVVIDPNWGLGDLAYTQVRNMYMYLNGTDYLFTFLNPAVFSFLKFVNVAMNTGGFITATGSGTAAGTETIVFENCTNDIPGYADGFLVENVNLFLINTDISAGSVTVTASSADSVNYQFVANNARFYTNDIHVKTNNASTLTTFITACNTMGRTLNIDGVNNTVNVDSTSYMFTLALNGGATLANLVLPTKTDGMTNSSYSPSNYVPSGDTAFEANTLTGNLKGIDEALPQTVINGMTASGFAGVSAVTVLGSHEVKVGNIVVGSIKLQFTSTGSVVNIHAGKSFGSGFLQLEQAIGSGICAKAPFTALGDGSVQIVQAVLFASELELVMDVNGADDYRAEINFTYEVI